MNKYILSIGLVFTMSFTPTFAQEEVERSVEEVVVTALRQESNLQDTAITITAITAEDLETKQSIFKTSIDFLIEKDDTEKVLVEWSDTNNKNDLVRLIRE